MNVEVTEIQCLNFLNQTGNTDRLIRTIVFAKTDL